MSLENVKSHLMKFGLDERIIIPEASSATVAEAAAALGCEECEIAKTMSFIVEDAPIVIVMAGDARIDNGKYKGYFHTKAVMIKPEEVEALLGHPVGGVCPFALPSGVNVYLDESLRRFDYIYPAAGTRNSAVKLTPAELESASGAKEWICVTKGWGEDGE
jgi:prolyl-tRNA editing enzyme YbaK/EbsC (Cys-tRNA(Pro) deacylase)